MRLEKVISGGQTGVDRAALDAAISLGIPTGGWCPKGRLAEDGRIEDKYPLTETLSSDTAQRTEWNIRDSDGSLVIVWNPMPKDGTVFALECLKKWKKPHLVINLSETPKPKIEDIVKWIQENNIKVISIGGPRGSFAKNVYTDAFDLICKILSQLVEDEYYGDKEKNKK